MVFAQSVKVRRMIEKIALDPKQTFWIMTVNLWLMQRRLSGLRSLARHAKTLTGRELSPRSSTMKSVSLCFVNSVFPKS